MIKNLKSKFFSFCLVLLMVSFASFAQTSEPADLQTFAAVATGMKNLERLYVKDARDVSFALKNAMFISNRNVTEVPLSIGTQTYVVRLKSDVDEQTRKTQWNEWKKESTGDERKGNEALGYIWKQMAGELEIYVAKEGKDENGKPATNVDQQISAKFDDMSVLQGSAKTKFVFYGDANKGNCSLPMSKVENAKGIAVSGDQITANGDADLPILPKELKGLFEGLKQDQTTKNWTFESVKQTEANQKMAQEFRELAVADTAEPNFETYAQGHKLLVALGDDAAKRGVVNLLTTAADGHLDTLSNSIALNLFPNGIKMKTYANQEIVVGRVTGVKPGDAAVRTFLGDSEYITPEALSLPIQLVQTSTPENDTRNQELGSAFKSLLQGDVIADTDVKEQLRKIVRMVHTKLQESIEFDGASGKWKFKAGPANWTDATLKLSLNKNKMDAMKAACPLTDTPDQKKVKLAKALLSDDNLDLIVNAMTLRISKLARTQDIMPSAFAMYATKLNDAEKKELRKAINGGQSDAFDEQGLVTLIKNMHKAHISAVLTMTNNGTNDFAEKVELEKGVTFNKTLVEKLGNFATTIFNKGGNRVSTLAADLEWTTGVNNDVKYFKKEERKAITELFVDGFVEKNGEKVFTKDGGKRVMDTAADARILCKLIAPTTNPPKNDQDMSVISKWHAVDSFFKHFFKITLSVPLKDSEKVKDIELHPANESFDDKKHPLLKVFTKANEDLAKKAHKKLDEDAKAEQSGSESGDTTTAEMVGIGFAVTAGVTACVFAIRYFISDEQ